MSKVHSEMEYMGIHSDLCPPDCDFKKITDEHRAIYHAALDEWLDNSRGGGAFYIANEGYTIETKN